MHKARNKDHARSPNIFFVSILANRLGLPLKTAAEWLSKQKQSFIVSPPILSMLEGSCPSSRLGTEKSRFGGF